LRARYLYLGDGEFLAPAELVWDRVGRIAALRCARGPAPIADVALFPGLVNAHAHLQLGPLARKPRGFMAWIRAVMRSRAEVSTADHRARATWALRELVMTGTTAVGEIDSTGQSPAALRRVPLAGRCFQELTRFHLDRRAARALVVRRARVGSPRCPSGLSPHAPYSVSPELMAAAAAHGRSLSVHTAEVPEEQQFLRTGRGLFADLLAALDRLPPGFRAPGVGAVRYLSALGLLRPGTQLVHCQELERGDAARIARSGASVTVCPGTIDYFGRQPPPVPKWLAAGIPVALGTDSIASNERLAMPRELALAASWWPELSPAELLSMATRHGAAALRRPGLGKLRRGGAADFFSVAAASSRPQEILEEFVSGCRAVGATWLRGRAVQSTG